MSDVEKLKCVISYDGTNFSGFQIQPGKRTIQGKIEQALAKIHKGEPIRIQSSGRTDTGVHAEGQVIHFISPIQMPSWSWQRALNTLLPADIHVRGVKKVEDSFHARYDAKEKEYRYLIDQVPEKNVFKRNYVYHFPYKLDIELMKQACTYFVGTHDFTTFSSAKATIRGSKVRTLYEVSCERRGNTIEFILRGDGFLYHMVRIIVGVILAIGQGKIPPGEVKNLLDKKDRRLAGKTVPAQGLYLYDVAYGDDD
ncbi:tRNA pseudouridine(38-40) synthase TruA [Virgibacillus sp. W0181]|uniref:tRNA pseudouridine(38-40) synthase TruA n=1 Tax=Virgibacillus sp. W0181 TaxID=3391581 RepID=UPI003F47FCA9